MRPEPVILLACLGAVALACNLYAGGRSGGSIVDATDGGEDDATAPDFDAAAVVDAADVVVDATNPCDKDKDGYTDRYCGGNDCCDLDALVHIGVTDFFDHKNACARWDYNCDDLSEQEFHAETSCANCSDKYFTAPTACGDTGTLVTCSFERYFFFGSVAQLPAPQLALPLMSLFMVPPPGMGDGAPLAAALALGAAMTGGGGAGSLAAAVAVVDATGEAACSGPALSAARLLQAESTAGVPMSASVPAMAATERFGRFTGAPLGWRRACRGAHRASSRGTRAPS